jgi:hypothetical protein
VSGEVLKFHVGQSSRRSQKVICSVQINTSTKEAIHTLRRKTFQGRLLDFQILQEMKAPEEDLVPISTGDSGAAVINNQSVNQISILIAKLPTNTKVSVLKHHIQSHVGGQVTELECSKSSKGGMKAACQVHTTTDPAAALDRLQRARFQGHFLHVQPVEGSIKPNIGGEQGLGGRASPEMATCETFGPTELSPKDNMMIAGPTPSHIDLISRKLNMLKGVSTTFCSYVLSDPGRVYSLDKGDDAIDKLFDEYIMETLLPSSRQTQGQCQGLDDDSRAWVQEEEPTYSPVSAPATLALPDEDQLGHDLQDILDQLVQPRAFESRDEPGANTIPSESPVALLDSLENSREIEHDLGLSEVSFECLGHLMEKDMWSIISNT